MHPQTSQHCRESNIVECCQEPEIRAKNKMYLFIKLIVDRAMYKADKIPAFIELAFF